MKTAASSFSGKTSSTRTADKKSRDELILHYAPLVKNIVGRLAAKLPIDAADKEDLINVGIMGLMSALEKYDASRNVQFETYAGFRIRGAVLDELRAKDWVPRATRSKDNKIEGALSALRKRLGRAPDENELAAHLGVTLDEYFKMLDEARCVSLISTEDLPPDYLEKFRREDVLEEMNENNPLALLVDMEFKDKLKQAIDRLPPKEKLVLSLYYYEELTMKEAGRVMELTESRVCQLHAQAVLRLREMIKFVG
ncbi:MAG: FliA/WhiG family RNA polymerase sigma factor [Deltaproteobacteria bacterium]|jgi:RNA polymerase sigma factor for flagellar operon FliA|nr:FliA/WhiG family RNA polymerase sigma factor [Syntrophaceae bacterium]